MRIKGLSNDARTIIHAAYLDAGADLGPVQAVVDYARHHGRAADDGQWLGDRCGCLDDRCIGHHHDADEECGCVRDLATVAARAHVGVDSASLVSVATAAGISTTPMTELVKVIDSADFDAAADAAVLEALELATAAVKNAERAQLLAVRKARKADTPWRLIGDLLGTSGPAAHQKFSKLV